MKFEFIKVSCKYGSITYYTRKDGILVIGSVDTDEKRARLKFNDASNNSCDGTLPIDSITSIIETIEK